VLDAPAEQRLDLIDQGVFGRMDKDRVVESDSEHVMDPGGLRKDG
jgi:hypothetical protein